MKTKSCHHHLSIIKSTLAGISCIMLIFNSIGCKRTDLAPVIEHNSISSINSLNSLSSLSPAMVLLWDNAASQVAALAGHPLNETFLDAQVTVAMHDALNSIIPKYKTYALMNTMDKDADPNAAVVKAAHDVIVASFPAFTAYADSLYQVSLQDITDGTAKTKGIILGAKAAAAMLAKRANDGSATANEQIPYTQGTLPGQYRFTPPFDGPPFNGFVIAPGGGNIKPYVIASSSQFRPVAPYPIKSADYIRDYNEAKSLGAAVNSTRTPEQTQIGLFWVEVPPPSWNRLARALIVEKKLDAWGAARLLGLLNLAQSDASIGFLEAKYYYNYWRPITAIRMGDVDGNPNTGADPSWDVLAPPTPPFPDYPSAHAMAGGAAAQVLNDFFGPGVNFSLTSASLPNVTRHYSGFSQAALENAVSRIYVGYHFRNAVNKGVAQGFLVGDYVFNHALLNLDRK